MREIIGRAIRLGGYIPARWSAADIERYVEQYAEADLETADAVLSAIEAAGRVIVPREATNEMYDAAWPIRDIERSPKTLQPDWTWTTMSIWNAMVAASLAAPVDGGG